MFDNISLDDYDLFYELQGSQFFKDCLHPEIDFQLKNGSVSVYKQLDSGISEEISVDELIYFIQYDVAKYLRNYTKHTFRGYFHTIDSIRNAVENMKILLKYGELEEEEEVLEEVLEEEEEEEPLMTEVSTVKIG